MSKLTNAPLIESNFRIRWHIRNPKEMSNIQFLLGDLYAKIRDDFPRRSEENLGHAPANMIYDDYTHKFQPDSVDFPFIKIGSNNLKVLTTDDYYDWDTFSSSITKATQKLNDILLSLINPDHYHLYLQYVDFYEFDFKSENIFDFLKNSMHLNLEQTFYDNQTHPSEIDINFNYKLDIGDIKFGFMKGRVENKVGLIVITEVESDLVQPNNEEIVKWIDKAHTECQNSFKKMTEGDLYNSFQ